MNNFSMKVQIELIKKIFENHFIVKKKERMIFYEIIFFVIKEILHDLHHLGYPFHHQHLWQELTGLPCPSTTTE
jgi:hypothetical protein